ncbi:MAG: hypothetical protein ACR2NP_04155 [Pirellulaceae bacterium]
MNLFANIFTDAIWPPIFLLVAALVPLLLFAWLIHLFEALMERRLASRFGWNSVMLTGWLGTPVHELSHALMCVLFRHEIVEMKLFEPDRENRRLGYVIHSYQRGNWYQEIGNFFIGIAPLIGGTCLLLVLLMAFFPDVGRTALFSTSADLPLWPQVGSALQGLFSGLLNVNNLASVRLWLFLYIVTCVGCHMAPSMDDYRGALKGGIMLLILLAVASVVIALVSPDATTLVSIAKPVLVPVITVMIAVIVLCAISTCLVYLATEITDWIRNRSRR